MIKCKLGACWAAPCRLHHHLPYMLQTDSFWGTTSMPAEFSYTARNRGMGLEVPSVPLAPSPSWNPISREARSTDPSSGSASSGCILLPASKQGPHLSWGHRRGQQHEIAPRLCCAMLKEQDWLYRTGKKTNENKKKRRKERNSGVGGDTVAAPSALRPGVAHRVKQQRHLAGLGVKPICNTSPGL